MSGSPITAQTQVYAVVGHPVRHSLSPALHNAWFQHHGIDAVYVALDTPEPDVDLAKTLRDLGIHGANLTLPHKVAILPDLAVLGPDAEACGAVNTVVRRGAELHGYNTDRQGFLDGLDELQVDPSGARAIVLGAGGAARSIVSALQHRGAADVIVYNRTLAHAQALVSPGTTTVRALPWPDDPTLPCADLVVNTLPQPGRAAVEGLRFEQLKPDAAWVDLNYWDPDPPHLRALAATGRRVQTGHAMLLHQAARAFAHFTGIKPDLALGLDQLRRHDPGVARSTQPR
ncbi:MAG: shikimate dehydrogenase [Myxococcota bacterium]